MQHTAYHSGAKEADNSQTPWWVIHRMEDVANVDIVRDVCATDISAKSDIWWTKKDDCLSLDWADHYGMEATLRDAFWMNPPFSMAAEFTEKAFLESVNGCVTLGCVKHAPDTDWFQKMEKQANYIFVPDGRIQFLDAYGNPFMREKKEKGIPTGEFVPSGANFPVCFPLWTPFSNGGEAKQIRFKRSQEEYEQ